jgi:hypothetical protein
MWREIPENRDGRTFGGMPLMTGIKRIYKKRATVKRPENTERPTKGLVDGRKRVIEVSHGSYFKKIKNLKNRASGAASAQIRASREGVWNQ